MTYTVRSVWHYGNTRDERTGEGDTLADAVIASVEPHESNQLGFRNTLDEIVTDLSTRAESGAWGWYTWTLVSFPVGDDTIG